MKRWWAVPVAAAVLSIALFYGYQQLQQKQISSLESIVPGEDILYYVSSDSPAGKIKKFHDSGFFKEFSETPVYKKFILPRIAESNRKIPALPAVLELLDKEVSLALFPGADAANIPNFLLLARIGGKGKSRIAREIGEFYLAFVSKKDVTYRKYKGIRITNYRLPDAEATVSCAVLSDVAVFGNTPGIVEKSIDLFKAVKQESLDSDQSFRKFSAKVKKDALFWGYTNTKNYYAELLRGYTYNSLRNQPDAAGAGVDGFLKMKPLISLMNGLEGSSFYADYDDLKDGLKFRYFLGFNRKADEENMLGILFSSTVLDKASLNLVLEDVIAYAGSSQDLLNYWKLLKKYYRSLGEVLRAQIQADPRSRGMKIRPEEISFDRFLDQVDAFLGISLEKDLIAQFGNDSGAVLVGIEDETISLPAPPGMTSGPAQREFPIVFPQAYVFFSLKDTARMQAVMENLTGNLVEKANQGARESQRRAKEAAEEKSFAQIRVEDYNGIKISCVDILGFPVDFFKINYCVLDKYLVLSLSPELTKRVIDSYAGRKNSFNSSLSSEMVRDKVSADYSTLVFFDFKRLLGNIKASKLFAKLNETLDKQKNGKFSRDDLSSILSTLSNFQSFAQTTKLTDPDMVEISAYIKINGL